MKIPTVAPEQWGILPDFVGYEVSTHGRVRTIRKLNGRGVLEHPRLMTLRPSVGKPYLRVKLATPDGRYVDKPVHQLVLLTFIGPRPDPSHDSCHDDGNAKNNLLSNLYWGTKLDNAAGRLRHGTQVRGVNVSLAKLTDEQVAEIKQALPIWKKGMGKHFAEKFGVGNSAISSIKHGLTWNHV